MIADKAFTMADLRSMGNDSIVLPTIRDALTIRVREEGKRKYLPIFKSLFECCCCCFLYICIKNVH